MPAEYEIPRYRVQLVREGTVQTRARIHCAADVASLVWDYLDGPDREHFVVLLVDTQHHVVAIHTVAIGTLDTSVVHPREVFKAAILASAAAVVLAHNHPSGDPAPSPEDRQVTRDLAAAGEIVGIPVIDHVIVGDRGQYVSFVESGLMGAS